MEEYPSNLDRSIATYTSVVSAIGIPMTNAHLLFVLLRESMQEVAVMVASPTTCACEQAVGWVARPHQQLIGAAKEDHGRCLIYRTSKTLTRCVCRRARCAASFQWKNKDISLVSFLLGARNSTCSCATLRYIRSTLHGLSISCSERCPTSFDLYMLWGSFMQVKLPSQSIELWSRVEVAQKARGPEHSQPPCADEPFQAFRGKL